MLPYGDIVAWQWKEKRKPLCKRPVAAVSLDCHISLGRENVTEELRTLSSSLHDVVSEIKEKKGKKKAEYGRVFHFDTVVPSNLVMCSRALWPFALCVCVLMRLTKNQVLQAQVCVCVCVFLFMCMSLLSSRIQGTVLRSGAPRATPTLHVVFVIIC